MAQKEAVEAPIEALSAVDRVISGIPPTLSLVGLLMEVGEVIGIIGEAITILSGLGDLGLHITDGTIITVGGLA
jgi:hypothetical protein